MTASADTASRPLPAVAMVTPIHNRVRNLPRFLESVRVLNYPRLKLVVVDDGSSDGSGDYVRSAFPDATILEGNGGLWWSAATNLGIKWAVENGYDYVLTFNDDQTCDPDFLIRLVSYAVMHEPAVLAPHVYFMDNPRLLLSGGIGIDRRSRRTFGVLNGTCPAAALPPYEVDGTPGYAMLIPLAAIKQVGYFDERRFPQIFMELDYCVRAKERGFRIVIVPESVIWNDRSDKDEDPTGSANPFARFRWYLTRPKSHLHFRQNVHLAEVLFGSRVWSRTLRFRAGFWLRYGVKLLGAALVPKPELRRIRKLLRPNADNWA